MQSDCCIEVDTNAYSVPWRLIGESVSVVVAGGRISIQHGGQEVAIHPESAGRRQRLVEAAHFQGLAQSSAPAHEAATRSPDLLRPLEEYEALVGGGW